MSAARQIDQDTEDVREIELAMFYALQGTVAKMVAGERCPEDLPSVLVVAGLANIGRTLGALMTSEERDDMYAFIVENGMLIIDGSMKTTVALLRAQAMREATDADSD